MRLRVFQQKKAAGVGVGAEGRPALKQPRPFTTPDAPSHQPAAPPTRGHEGRAAARGHDLSRFTVSRPSGSPAARRGPGLPERLKSGIERLSGFSLGDVRVHYNSPAPARLEASAHTQGADIHLAPGQERHLAHEAWHVVQQKQGRVRATERVSGQLVNDDAALEREADAMGARAAAAATRAHAAARARPSVAPAPPAFVGSVAQCNGTKRKRGSKGRTTTTTTTKKRKTATGSRKTKTSGGGVKKPTTVRAGKKAKTPKKTNAGADPQMAKLLAKFADKKARNRHAKQDTALQNLAESGTKEQRKEFVSFFEGSDQDRIKANEEAITKNVRLGGLNELLRTADTPKAAIKSMGVKKGIRPSQTTTSGGKKNWIDYQRETSGPTENFIFKDTSPSKSGKGVIQDSHTNALIKEGGKPTVGGTSWQYHNSPTQESLLTNFEKSTHVRSLSNRNLKLHQSTLVTDPQQILQTPSKKRSRQEFKTKGGEVLKFDDEDDLQRIANISAVRGLKELTRQKRFRDTLEPADSESESEADDPSHLVDSDVESEEEGERLFGPKKKKQKTEPKKQAKTEAKKKKAKKETKKKTTSPKKKRKTK